MFISIKKRKTSLSSLCGPFIKYVRKQGEGMVLLGVMIMDMGEGALRKRDVRSSSISF